MKPKSRLHLFCDDLNKFFLKPETKSKDEEVGVPSCGGISQHQVQWCPHSPTPKSKPSPPQPLGPPSIFQNSNTLFFQKQDSRIRKTSLPAPFSFPAELRAVRWALSRPLQSWDIKIPPAHGWREPLCGAKPLCPPYTPSCFSPIFYLSQKADEAGRNLRASPGLASLCATNRWCVGRAFKSSAATNFLF